jgi:hypothetical protein
MENKKGGFSDADNDQAGRLLMMGALLVVGLMLLMVSPIVMGGFVIGLIWYGAYMEDGEPNGERLAWPIAITLSVFVFLFGAPVILTDRLQGVLFTCGTFLARSTNFCQKRWRSEISRWVS